MQARTIPELVAAKLQVEIEKMFNLIEEALNLNKISLVITHLYALHTFIQKNIQPYYGKGKLLPIATPVNDFDIAGLIELFQHEFTGLEKKYNNVAIRNGTILLEALQTALSNAAAKEDCLSITNITLIKGMLKLLSAVTNNKFILNDINLEKEVDPVVASLDVNIIIRGVQGKIYNFFYKPVEVMLVTYQCYVVPMGDNLLRKFRPSSS